MSSLPQDKRIRFAFAIGVLEWLLVGGLLVSLEDHRWVIGIVLASATWLQLGALFWHRRPTGLFPEAQEAFMEGDYVTASTKLEAVLQQDPQHLQAQTLLGNTYRQQGLLDASERLLRQALTAHPHDHFPLYGLGRTLLAKGDFEEAATLIHQALEQGGRKVIRAELALAHYCAEDHPAALAEAQRSARLLPLEPYRVLMVNYLLHRLNADSLAVGMIQRHAIALDYWRAESNRFASTPYGQRLQAELICMEEIIAKDMLS